MPASDRQTDGHRDKPSDRIGKTMSYCVVDESMRLLYDGGNGQVLSVVTRWMASDMEHLQNSAALAIGNVARSG